MSLHRRKTQGSQFRTTPGQRKRLFGLLAGFALPANPHVNAQWNEYKPQKESRRDDKKEKNARVRIVNEARKISGEGKQPQNSGGCHEHHAAKAESAPRKVRERDSQQAKRPYAQSTLHALLYFNDSIIATNGFARYETPNGSDWRGDCPIEHSIHLMGGIRRCNRTTRSPRDRSGAAIDTATLGTAL